MQDLRSQDLKRRAHERTAKEQTALLKEYNWIRSHRGYSVQSLIQARENCIKAGVRV